MSARLRSLNTGAVSPASSPNMSEETSSYQMPPIRDQVTQKALWVFIVIAIIVLVIMIYLARCKGVRRWFRSLNFKGIEWGKSTTVLAVITVVAVLLFAYGSFLAYHAALLRGDSFTSNLAMLGFAAHMLLLSIGAYMFFKKRSLSTAYYLMLIVLAVALLQAYYFWSVSRTAAYSFLIYALWAAGMVYMTWDVSSCNRCHESSDDSETSHSD